MSADLETLTPDAVAEREDADVEASTPDTDVEASAVETSAEDTVAGEATGAGEDTGAGDTLVEDDAVEADPEANPEADVEADAVVPDVEAETSDEEAAAEPGAEAQTETEPTAAAGVAVAEPEASAGVTEVPPTPATETQFGAAVVPPTTGDTDDAPRRRRRWPWVVGGLLLLGLLVAGGAFAGATVSYAEAYKGRFLPGTRINDVDVSGLTRDEAVRSVRQSLRGELRRTVRVEYGDQIWKARARNLGVRSNTSKVVSEVAALQKHVTWREWAGMRWFGEESTSSADVRLRYQRAPVAAFVAGIAGAVERDAKDAELNVLDGGISVTPHVFGRSVQTKAVTRDLMAALQGDNTPVPLAVERIAPEVRESAFDQVIFLDQSDHEVTLFLEGESVRSWIVAVGTGDYPTPLGRYEVTLKRYMPTWINPDPEGWGKDMPEMIPPGENNPLGVRALNWSAPGAIRFHGTQAIYSLGTDASHGCVRMSNEDVTELYDLVDEGAIIISEA